MANFKVAIDDQVYLEEGGEELGAVRKVEHDHIVVYVENAGDFKVSGPAVKASHDGKVILDRTQLAPEFLQAVDKAHTKETE
jgi:ribosomal protein L24